VFAYRETTMTSGFETSEKMGAEELPLFPQDAADAPPSADDGSPLALIDWDLRSWEGLCRLARRRARYAPAQPKLDDLGRSLRSIRDCYVASRHPRIRRALLEEAGRITRRMKVMRNDLGVRGFDIRPLAAR
jgi:hypothetical protein